MSSSSIDASTSPSLPLTPLQINTKLYSKYNSSNISYGIKKIDDLIFLETSLYTNKFREFLLYDEETDFLRRFYSSKEQIPKLKNILLFYKKYSKIFPNYIIMSGSKYLYKNIQKKQKMINNLQEMKKQEKRNRKLCLTITNESNLLGLTTMNSIMNVSSSFYKRNLMILFGFYNENNNNINVNVYDNNDDIDKLVKVIEKEEKRNAKKKMKKNVVMLKPFSKMERSTNVINTNNVNHNNNNNNVNNKKVFIKTHCVQHSQENSCMSPKFISSVYNNGNHKNNLSSNKTRLVLHKKISSQGFFTLNQHFTERNQSNSNLKKKILTLDINNHLNNNILFIKSHRHNRRRSVNQTPSNNSQQNNNNNNNNSLNTRHSKYLSTNLSPVKSERKLFKDKIHNNSSKSKKTKTLMFSSTNNSKLITSTNTQTQIASINTDTTEGRNKKLSYSHIKHLTEKILDSNSCNIVFTPKNNIKNRNAIRRNLSPNNSTIKNTLKTSAIVLNPNSSKVIIKPSQKPGLKELFNKVVSSSYKKLKIKKYKKNIQH